MDPVLFFATAVGVVAIASAPLLLPWPERIRWTVLAQVVGHAATGHVLHAPLDLREVVLTSVEAGDADLELRVLEVGHPAGDTLAFTSTSEPAAELVLTLQEWCALRTPMLLYVDGAGVASVSGPTATIAELRSVATSSQHSGARRQAKSAEQGPECGTKRKGRRIDEERKVASEEAGPRQAEARESQAGQAGEDGAPPEGPIVHRPGSRVRRTPASADARAARRQEWSKEVAPRTCEDTMLIR